MNKIICFMIIFSVFVFSGCNKAVQEKSDVGIANPASVFCEEQGGKLEIKTAADGSQSGYCTLKDGRVCEEWAYFRGECGEKICPPSCPQFAPPGPDFCPGGKIIEGNLDDCGCRSPPLCGQETACTEDAKICPDGSAVGRVAPNCEFAACP